MKKKWHKVLSLSLCVAMLGSNLGMSVLAEDVQIGQSMEVQEHTGHIHDAEIGDLLQILEDQETLTPDVQPSADPQVTESPAPDENPDTDATPTTDPEEEADSTPDAAPTADPEEEADSTPDAAPTANPEKEAGSTPGATPTADPEKEAGSTPGATPTANPEEETSPAPNAEPAPSPEEAASPVPSTEPTADPQAGETASPDATPGTGESPAPGSTPEAGESPAPGEAPGDEPQGDPGEETPGPSLVRDVTPPVITVDPDGQIYYCTAPTVTVADAGGNLVSIVAKSYSETINGTITDEGKTGTVVLKDEMGSVTITARDSSGNETTRVIYDSHSIKSLRRTDLPATCTEPAKRVSYFICGICGKEYGHSISTVVVADPDNPGEYKAKTPAKGHEFTEPAEAVEVCGAESGKILLRRCTTCGELIDESTGKIYKPQEGSEHQWSEPKKKNPTCTEPGYLYQECGKCHMKKITATSLDREEDGKTLTETAKSLQPLGHLIGEWTTAEGQETTCTSGYKQERRCMREGCTLTETRTMNAGSHSWDDTLVVLKEASCTEAGQKGYRCRKCDAVRVTMEIPAKGHVLASTSGDCTKGGSCGVCGAELPGNKEHSWSQAYQKDGSGHWKVCTVEGCQAKTELIPHKSRSKAYNCTKSWNCSDCGYGMPGNEKHAIRWVQDEEGACHWMECTNEGCTYMSSKATHYYGNVSNYDCTEGMVCQSCGYVKLPAQDAHDYVWVNTYSNVHWKKCRNEGCTMRTRYGDEEYGDHVYPKVRDCTQGIRCTLCGYQLYAPATEHSYADTIYSDAEGHFQLCRNYNCSARKRVGEHSGGKATCTQPAVCDVCHQPYGAVDAANHPDKVIEGEKEATEDAPGYTGDEVCKECGTVLAKGQEIPQLQKECNHEYEKLYDAEKCWESCIHCGHEKEKVYHSFQTIVSPEGHQQQCISCKYTTTLAPHVPAEEDYDCTTSLNCKECGYEIVAAAEHSYGDTFLSGTDGHWKECENENCDRTSPVQTHIAQEDDGNCMTDVVCRDCGFVMFAKAESHQYSGVWETDENGHYQNCINSGCTEVKREEHTWTQDDKDCTTPVVCTVCNYVQAAGEAAHEFGGAYLTDEDGHWQKCQNAGCEAVSGENEHTGGTASCRKQAVCEICGTAYGPLDPDYHAGGTELREYKEPTLEEEGFSGDTYCLGCGKMLEAGYILDKLQEEHEHSYDLPRYDGTYHWMECPCGAQQDLKEHGFGEWQSDSTHHWHVCSGCEAVEGQGSHTYEDGACTICGYRQEIHEHIYEWKSDDAGHEQVCISCGETANASAHTYEWCTGDEEHWQVCTACGHIAGKAAHKLELRSDRTYHWLACTQEGCSYEEAKTVHEVEDDHNCATEVKCKTCDTIVVAAKEHNWNPVYTFDGENHWRECMNEDCSQKEDIAAHSLTGDTKDCTADISCADCGYIARKGADGHKFDGSPYYSAENHAGHWKVCQNEGCEATDTPEIHTGGTATCVRQAECEVCHMAYGARNPQNHEGNVEMRNESPATEEEAGYTGDKVCTGCDAVLEYGQEIPRLEAVCTHTGADGESLFLQFKDDKQSWYQCSKCGEIDESRVVPHSYDGYEHDESGHWQVCTICGYSTKDSATGALPHIAKEYDNDCSTPVVCETCGYTMTAAKEHSFGGAYLSSVEGHWQICQNEDCGVVSGTVEHIVPDKEKGDCTVAEVCETCGYTVTAAMSGHNYDTVWSAEADGSGHSQACLNMGCQQKRTEAHTPGTDDHLCTTPVVCTACGAVTTEAKEHKLEGSKYFSSETGHWRVCQNEGCTYVGTEEPHADADSATCVSQANCSVCGKSYGSVNPENHADKEGELVRNVEPTELQEGYTGDKVCRHCGGVLEKGAIIPKLEPSHKHEFNVHVSDSERHWLECACGVRDEASVSAHTYGVWETNDKEHWHTCTGCDNTLRDPHTFDKKGQCTACGKWNHEHRGGKASCKEPAACEVCGTPYGSKSAEHSWGAWTVTAEATVFDEGTQQRVCAVCGAKETNSLPVLEPTVKVNAAKVPLKVGQSTKKLKVSGLAAGDYVKSWKSSNKKIVTVSKKGKIKAKKAGKATITVTLASGKKQKIKVVIKKSAVKTKKISVKSKKISLKKGAKFSLKATVNPFTSLQKLSYLSSDSKVATVSKKGVIKAKKPGKAKITVRSGSKKVVVQLTVQK